MMWLDGIEARLPDMDERGSYTGRDEYLDGDDPDNREKIRQLMFS